jgi:hypothetical protein
MTPSKDSPQLVHCQLNWQSFDTKNAPTHSLKTENNIALVYNVYIATLFQVESKYAHNQTSLHMEPPAKIHRNLCLQVKAHFIVIIYRWPPT